MRMKDFFQLRNELTEASGATKGAGRHLNTLQDWWNKNSESCLKRGLYPIVDLPFDRVIKGGVMVLGINPGMTGGIPERALGWLEKHNMTAPVVYDFNADPRKGRWLFSYQEVIRGKPAKKKEELRRQLDQRFSVFDDDKDWFPLTTRPNSTSKFGVNRYHANLNKIFEQCGLPNMRRKIYMTNWIPFSSKDASSLKSSDYALCKPWIEHFIKTTKPSMVVVPTAVYNEMKSKGLGSFRPDKGGIEIFKPASDSQRSKGQKFSSTKMYKTYIMTIAGHEVPVVVMMHWSGAPGGMPSNKGWQDEDNQQAVGADLKRLLRGDYDKQVDLKLKS